MTVILKTRIDRRARSPAYADLRRVYDFVEPVDPRAAARAVRPIFNRIERIPAQPRLGERRPSDRDARKSGNRAWLCRTAASGKSREGSAGRSSSCSEGSSSVAITR